MLKAKYSVYWTEIAYNDLEGIVDYISNESIDKALDVLWSIRDKAENLNIFPERGRIVPELKFYNIENYRELVISPWRIIYRIDGKKVYVIAVFDGRRNFEDIILDRLLW
jgi:toxin ParE1/3/4